MKRYYIVATVLFYGIVTQTEAGVIPTQPAQPGVAVSLPNMPGAMAGAMNPPAVPNAQVAGIPGMSGPTQQSGMQMTGIPGAMAGAIQPAVSTAPEDVLPSPTVKGIIVHASLAQAQKALDDSSAFVLNDGQRVACFGAVNSVPRTGFVKPAENGQPAQCTTLDPNTGQMLPVSTFKVPLSNAPFEWRAGSAINPDEWATGTKGIPTVDHANPVTGVCAQKDPQSNNAILLGAAVRKQGTQHVCVLPNGMYPLNHPQVLVLAK